MTPAPVFIAVQGAPAQRLPASVVGSIGVHAALFALLMFAARSGKHEATHVISNVDLMIKVHKAVEVPKPLAKSPSPPSTWNFLKMALPEAPKLQQLNVAVPEHHQMMQVQPKLQDRGHLKDLPKLDALDMNKKGPNLAKLDVTEPSEHHSLKALAALPKLEEVGHRRYKNMDQAIKLDDERRQASGQLQQMNALGSVSEHRGPAAPAGAPLQDAEGAPPSSRFAGKIASMLPQGGLDMKDRAMPVQEPKGLAKAVEDQPVVKRKAAQQLGEAKKGVTIEGPLKNRRVVSYDIPEFPKWARDQGMLEAEVAIRFWVDKDGNVLDNMRVESTSGYGQLDHLAMDSLKNWKFAPVLEDARQWGVITFRFVLE
jgi:TonB family protein